MSQWYKFGSYGSQNFSSMCHPPSLTLQMSATQAGCQSVRLIMDTPALHLRCLCLLCLWLEFAQPLQSCRCSAFYTPVNLLNRMSIFRENKHILLNNFLPSVWPFFPSVHNRTRSQGRLCIHPVSYLHLWSLY